MLVSEVEKDGSDSAGAQICDVYARRPPDYAVYRTIERVLIHFADDRDREQAQRTAMARLNPIRGEINGLINGWRASRSANRQSKAKRYDRRVGDALILAFEQDVNNAELLLSQIKKDIIDERTSWARFSYLIVASATVAAAIALFSFMNSQFFINRFYDFPAESWNLWFAAGTGTVGAFFSIAIGIRNRTVLTDLRTRDNSLDAVLRVVIGSIAATLLICLVQSKAVTFQIGNANLESVASTPSWLYVLIIAFVGGFSERLVPDLLGKVTTETPSSPTSKAAATASAAPSLVQASSGSATVGAAVVESRATDQEEEDDACLCDLVVQPDETTLDNQLPAAIGGVATPRR